MSDPAEAPASNTHVPRIHIDSLPIPHDVQPGKGWTGVMLELADHIGAYATLVLVDQFGGTDPYIPSTPAKAIARFGHLIGAEKAEQMAWVYGRTCLQIPVAGHALRRARRQGVLAAVRARKMSLTEAARIKGMGSRTYISALVNHSNEGEGAIPFTPRKALPDPRQLVMFGDEEEAA